MQRTHQCAGPIFGYAAAECRYVTRSLPKLGSRKPPCRFFRQNARPAVVKSGQWRLPHSHAWATPPQFRQSPTETPRRWSAGPTLDTTDSFFATSEDRTHARKLCIQRGKADFARLKILFTKTARKPRQPTREFAAATDSGTETTSTHVPQGWGKYVEAAEIFHRLLAERRLESAHLNLFLKNCFSSERQLQLAELGRRLGIEPDGHTVGTVVSRLLIEGDAGRARETLVRMQPLLHEPGDLSALLRRTPEELLRMRVDLADRWIRLGSSGAVAVRALIATLQAQGLHASTTALYNVTLKQRGLCPSAAQSLVDTMRGEGIPRSEVTYSTLLNVYRLYGADGKAARDQAKSEGLARVDVSTVWERSESKYDVARATAIRDLCRLRGPREYAAVWRLYAHLRREAKASPQVVLAMTEAAATKHQFERLVAHLLEAEQADAGTNRPSPVTRVLQNAADPKCEWKDVHVDTRSQRYMPLFVAARKWSALQSPDAPPHLRTAHVQELVRWGLYTEAMREISAHSTLLDAPSRNWLLDRFAETGKWTKLDATFRIDIETVQSDDRHPARKSPAVDEALSLRQVFHTAINTAIIDFRCYTHVGSVVATLRALLSHVRATSEKALPSMADSLNARLSGLFSRWRRPDPALELAWMTEDIQVLVDNDTVAVTVDALFSRLEPPIVVTWLSKEQGVVDRVSLWQWATTSSADWHNRGWFAPPSPSSILRWP